MQPIPDNKASINDSAPPDCVSFQFSPSSLFVQAYSNIQNFLAPPIQKVQNIVAETFPLLNVLKAQPTISTPQTPVDTPQSTAFRQAALYAWSVSAFEEVMLGVDWPVILPGPGNGYFEALRNLLKTVDQIANAAGCSRIDHRQQLARFFSGTFEHLPLNTDTQYPVEIYFMALNVWLRELKESRESPLFSDFWTVSLQLSDQTRCNGLVLLEKSHRLFSLLRQKEQKLFLEHFQSFDVAWGKFLDQLIYETEKGSSWVGSLYLNCTVEGLKSERYKAGYESKMKEFNRAITTFNDSILSSTKDQLMEHIQYEVQEDINPMRIEEEGPISTKPLIIKAIKQTIKDSYLRSSLEKLLSGTDPFFYQLIPQLALIELSKITSVESRFPDIFKGNQELVHKLIKNISLIRDKSNRALHVLRRSVFTYSRKRLGKDAIEKTILSDHQLFSINFHWITWLIPWKSSQTCETIPPLAAPQNEIAEIDNDIKKMELDKDLFELGTLVNETQADSLYPILQEIYKNHKIITLIPVIKTQILAKKIVKLGMHTLEVPLYPSDLEQRKITDI